MDTDLKVIGAWLNFSLFKKKKKNGYFFSPYA